MNHHRPMILSAVGALALTMALAGCDRQDQADARNGKDVAVAQAERQLGELKTDAKQGMADAKDAAHELKQDAQRGLKEAGNKVADAVITTEVNASLAKDPSLSALKIDVDTDNGRVALIGTAPDAASRDRATQLAAEVKGVVGVDNRLRIEPK